MEHNLTADHSKTSSAVDETDRSDQNSDMGTGRSYECVFCKRGFTTAQALGGHMNIHRKDRVKTKNTSIASNSSKNLDVDQLQGFNYGTVRPNQVTHSYPSHHLSMPSELHINYQTYLPSSTWSLGSTTSQDKDELYVQNDPQLLNVFKENWQRNLSAQVGASHPMDHHIQEKRAGNGEEDELDLELRLGHDR